MATGKGIAATVAAVAAIGGLIAYNTTPSEHRVPSESAGASAAAPADVSEEVTLLLTRPVGSEWTETTRLHTTEEITMNIASQARNTEVRAKASTLLQQLRKPRS